MTASTPPPSRASKRNDRKPKAPPIELLRPLADIRPPETDRRLYNQWLRDLQRARAAADRLDLGDLLHAMMKKSPTMLVYFEDATAPDKLRGWSPHHWFMRGDKVKLMGAAMELATMAMAAKPEQVRDNTAFLTSLTIDYPAKAGP